MEHRGDEHRINDTPGSVKIIDIATEIVLFDTETMRTEPIDVTQEGISVSLPSSSRGKFKDRYRASIWRNY